MNETTDAPVLSQRFKDAIDFAARLHQSRVRRGTRTSGMSHLEEVTALVLEHGGSEDEAIAALLHDAAEGPEGRKTLEDIRERFGNLVAGLVAECSDTFETPRPSWRERKERDIAAVSGKSPSARLILAADKLHNATTILKDFREHGDSIWGRFKGGRDGALCFFRTYAISLCTYGPNDLGSDLLRVVFEMERLAGLGAPRPPEGARDFSELFYKRTYYCPCGHTWTRENEHIWWDTQRAPSEADIAASKRMDAECPQCGKPVPPAACPECGGAVSVEAGNLCRSALEDWAYEEEDFTIRCADGHAFMFAHRFDGER